VRLALLPDEESLDVGARGEGSAGHRVGAHGQAPDGGGARRLRLGGDELAKGAKTVGAEDRPLRVHVVLRLAAAREGDLADHERVLAKRGDQSLASAQAWASRTLRPRR
jgi:hypothetical protein